MIELWARGNNIWRQLEFAGPHEKGGEEGSGEEGSGEEGGGGDEEEEREPRNLDVYGKVFEAERVEWVGSDGGGCIVKYNSSSYAVAGSPTPFLLLNLEERGIARNQNALVGRHAQALQRNGVSKGWAVSGTGVVV
ncbi:hypothetical protein V494_04696, partial [Pseudogymnoascus sp. VKM F-4513 (FW-928)]